MTSPGTLLSNELVTVLSADASSHGIVAGLMQCPEDKMLRTVTYVSKSLTGTEKGYSQIEKETLAITWASETFKDCLMGLAFHLETDHKPFVPLFTREPVDDLIPSL